MIIEYSELMGDMSNYRELAIPDSDEIRYGVDTETKVADTTKGSINELRSGKVYYMETNTKDTLDSQEKILSQAFYISSSSEEGIEQFNQLELEMYQKFIKVYVQDYTVIDRMQTMKASVSDSANISKTCLIILNAKECETFAAWEKYAGSDGNAIVYLAYTLNTDNKLHLVKILENRSELYRSNNNCFSWGIRSYKEDMTSFPELYEDFDYCLWVHTAGGVHVMNRLSDSDWTLVITGNPEEELESELKSLALSGFYSVASLMSLTIHTNLLLGLGDNYPSYLFPEEKENLKPGTDTLLHVFYAGSELCGRCKESIGGVKLLNAFSKQNGSYVELHKLKEHLKKPLSEAYRMIADSHTFEFASKDEMLDRINDI